MSLAAKISSGVKSFGQSKPEKAYDMLAEQYDKEDNLLLKLDEEVFNSLLSNISIQNKIVADVGCGTGRYWGSFYAQYPAKLLGFDVSYGMLKELRKKHPSAIVYKTNSLGKLNELDNSACDVLISTLTIGYIKDIETAIAEWCRVLKDNGVILLTDYHPEILRRGGDRTFIYKGNPLPVKNYIHPLEKIRNIAEKLNLQVERIIERPLSDSEKVYYEKKNALHVFERFNGQPLLYGLHLNKGNVAS